MTAQWNDAVTYEASVDQSTLVDPKTSKKCSVLIFGPPKTWKCLSGDTIMYDPGTGRPTTIKDVVEGSEASVFTMKEASVIVPQRPSGYSIHEPAQLYRLTTQTGRSIEATGNHPFLTRGGWKDLSDLGVGDRVAIIAEYPSMFGSTKTNDSLIKILAYLIADGSLGPSSSPVFTKADPEVRMDFEAAVEARGGECVEFTNKEGISHVRVRGKKGKRNSIITFLKKVGLHGLRSPDKFIPDFVFGLKKRKLALFLNRLFTCDGSVHITGQVSYSSTSTRLVQQVQHLLSRFGIVSIVGERLRGGEHYGSDLAISSKANVLRFIDEIGFFGGKLAKAEVVRAALYQVRGSETQLDRLGPIVFDRVISVVPTHVDTVYDLTVDGSHNFVANDFVVHNSTWCYQWPAPIVLNIVAEGGNAALGTYPQIAQYLLSQWKNKDLPPPVFNRSEPPHFDIYYSGSSRDAENISGYPPKHCLLDAIKMIEANWLAWGVATVVLDSIGFLQRLWMTDLIAFRYSMLSDTRPPPGLQGLGRKSNDPSKRWAERMQEQGGVLFERADYGQFNNFLQVLQEGINALPLNRIIVGHEQAVMREKLNAQGRPTGETEVDKIVLGISGQNRTYVPAGADLIIQTELKEEAITLGSAVGRRVTRPIFWTTPDEKSIGSVGHRFAFAFSEGKLVDPEIPGVPTFRAVYNRIYNHIALPSRSE